MDKQSLLDMLTYRRPDGSPSERRFINRFIRPLGVEEDDAGNLIKAVGGNPHGVLWSSHTDTVHRQSGRQKIINDNDFIRLAPGSNSNCLGADCAAGVWLMREMIKAKTPGLYIFHRGEECGGVGSSHIAQNTPELLEGIKFAVAFDRYGEKSVITHQGWQKTASNEFAHQLADALNAHLAPLFPYKPDDGGLFTDTANYADIVAECTNISVGYDLHHTAREYVNFAVLPKLLKALLSLDQSTLQAHRQPGDCGWYGDNAAASRFYDLTDPEAEDDFVRLVEKYPRLAAEVLTDFGFPKEEFLAEIYKKEGVYEGGMVNDDSAYF